MEFVVPQMQTGSGATRPGISEEAAGLSLTISSAACAHRRRLRPATLDQLDELVRWGQFGKHPPRVMGRQLLYRVATGANSNRSRRNRLGIG